jgi:hypothetical protein
MRFRYLRFYFTDFFLLPLIVFCLVQVDLMVYGLRMGKGQLEIVWNARPFGEVYADVTVSEEVKSKLHLIEEIKQFAYDSIGLKRSENYSTFFDQKGQQIMFVVTASERFSLTPHVWHFPILGDMPYKGFFVQAKAKEEYDRLKLLGLDADIGGASGWSTLGWFKDPVLSSMLKRSEGDLAELIIHELTHGTVFIKDDVDYNENLATFIGVTGATWYLTSRYGKDSEQYITYINGNSDEAIRTDFMLYSANYADSVYKTIALQKDIQFKKKVRVGVFDSIVARAKRLNFSRDSTFGVRLEKRLAKSGNTVLLQYTRYTAKQNDFFSQLKQLNNDLRLFIRKILQQDGAPL